MVEAGEDDLQRPGARRRVDVVGADELGDYLERLPLSLAEGVAHLAEQGVDLGPRLGDLRLRFAEGTAVAGQAEVDVERLDDVEAAEEFADRVGAVAVVEEQDRPPQEVIAGDHQLALGLVEDDVRGSVARGLVDLPGPEVGLDLDPGQEVAVGLDDRVDPGLVVAFARLAVALERRRRDAALARDLDPLLERRGGVVGVQPDMAPGRVHPELAAGVLDDRRRQAVVIGVGVGADEQPHVLEAEAGLGEGEVELAQPAAAAHPGVEEDDAAVGGDRPDVAVRDTGPGQRQAQPPDPGQHPLGSRRLRALGAHRFNPRRLG